jgi:AcrR family transcriptional regulator
MLLGFPAMPSRRAADAARPSRRLPVQQRAQRTAEAVLEAAAQILVQHGEAALTTNRIAERAGVSIGTLYQYFPDKQAIVGGLFDAERERVTQAIDAWLAEATAAGAPPEVVVRGVIRRMLPVFGGGPPERRALARIAWRMDRHERIARGMRESAERLGAYLQRWSGPAVPYERIYLEDSPLLRTDALEDGLVRLVLGLLVPADNPRS